MRTLFAVAALLLIAIPVVALERLVPPDFEDRGLRSGGTSCLLSYYNVCSNYGYELRPVDEHRYGVVYDACGSGCEVTRTAAHYWSLSTPGYGYTGSLAIHPVDASDCPTGQALASVPLIGSTTGGLVITDWGSVPVPDRFAVVLKFSGVSSASTPVLAMDHPEAVGGSPPDCGTCYPTTRESRSYDWGTASSPLCPGERMNFGLCDAEFIWQTVMQCNATAAPQTESFSWGRLKNIYR